MNRFIYKHNLLIHLYVISTLVGYLLLFPHQEIAMFCLAFGASSGYITFGISYELTVKSVIGLLACIWWMLFPIALVVVYIVAVGRTKKAFCTVVVMDLGIVFAWCLYALITKDYYSLKIFLPDLIVSFVYTLVLIGSVRRGEDRTPTAPIEPVKGEEPET